MNKNRKMPIIEQSVLLALIYFFPIIVTAIFGRQKDTFATTVPEKLTYCFTKTLHKLRMYLVTHSY